MKDAAYILFFPILALALLVTHLSVKLFWGEESAESAVSGIIDWYEKRFS